ncbi:hypothetical protein SESBI_16779 [Sesbania bispinosa]|nr:hypothetical protein SESBI_16779 [Sesbania bispinosa]
MSGNSESVTGDSPILQESEPSIIYLEEDEEIHIHSGPSIIYLEEDEEIPIQSEPSIIYLEEDEEIPIQNIVTGRWYCTWFDDDHNHDLLDAIHCGMLPAHRKMSESEINQMNEMMKVGIGPPHIYRSFALLAGGYQKIGFRKKDQYNQIHRQRREQGSDAAEALKYLEELKSKDGKMYIEHTIDHEGILHHLFWADGISQMNYMVYGDVLAFDATYGKNKYLLPLVVFPV